MGLEMAKCHTGRLERHECRGCEGRGIFHGVVCPRCEGRGMALTRRGQAAMAFLRSLTTRRADELRPGDRFRMIPYREPVRICRIEETTGASIPVVSIRRLDIHCMAEDGMTVIRAVREDMLFDLVLTGPEAELALDRALEYQSRLNSLGRPIRDMAG